MINFHAVEWATQLKSTETVQITSSASSAFHLCWLIVKIKPSKNCGKVWSFMYLEFQVIRCNFPVWAQGDKSDWVANFLGQFGPCGGLTVSHTQSSCLTQTASAFYDTSSKRKGKKDQKSSAWRSFKNSLMLIACLLPVYIDLFLAGFYLGHANVLSVLAAGAGNADSPWPW